MADIFSTIIGMGLFIIFALILLYLLSWVFWFIMFVHALSNRDWMWAIFFIVCALTGFLQWAIALIYYFVAYGRPTKKGVW